MNSYKRRRAAPDLARDEWDFSDCPDAEIWECHAYEFAREIQVIRDDVDSLRKNLPCTFEALVNALRSRIQSTPRAMALFWYCPEFPDKPYLTISAAERRRRFRMLWPRSATAAIAVIPKIIPPDLGQRLVSGRVFYGSHELALFEIDWTESPKFLTGAFLEWLRENRPPDVKIFERRGAGNFLREWAADLKALGAHRLLEKMKWHEAFELTGKVLGEERGLGGVGERLASRCMPTEKQVWRKAAKRGGSALLQHYRTHLYTSNRID